MQPNEEMQKGPTERIGNSADLKSNLGQRPFYDCMAVHPNSFSMALQAIKNGKRIAREDWFLTPKSVYWVPPGNYSAVTSAARNVFQGELVPYTGYLALITEDGTVTPWTPTHEDLLAQDWRILPL